MIWYDKGTPRKRLRALIDERWEGTDQDLAKAVPISPSQLSRLLNGRVELRSSRKIGLILERLGAAAEQLWYGRPVPRVEAGTWNSPIALAEGNQIIGHLKAELLRDEEETETSGREPDPQAAFERVESRLLRLLGRDDLSEAGWQYWLAVREGASLFGGYEPVDPDGGDGSQPIPNTA